MPSETWIEELRAGDLDLALGHLRTELKSPNSYHSNYYSLGAAYMWSGAYQSALDHFEEQMRARLPRNPAGDLAFGMAGAAAWCMGDEKSAIKYWQKGTTPGYAIAGANTRTSLLLYSASVFKPEKFPAETADEMLRKKTSHWRVKNWPGPIAQFIVGAASEEEVVPNACRKGDDGELNPRSWQFTFYKLLKGSAASESRMRALEIGLRDLLNVKGSEYLAGIRFFYFLRLEEYYLARHWSSERSGPQLT